MWVFRLQARRLISSKSVIFMMAGALFAGILFVETGNGGKGGITAYFFMLSVLFALFSTSISSQVPGDVLILSKPLRRRRALIEHLIAALTLSILVLFAGSLMALLNSSPGDVLNGALMALGYLLPLSAVGIFVGTIIRGWARGIGAVTAGIAILFAPMGLALLGKTGSLWSFIMPTLGPFLATIDVRPPGEGFLLSLVTSFPYLLAALIIYGRSEVR